MVKRRSLGFDGVLDLHVGDRDRDRSEEGSPPLEPFYQRGGTGRVGPGQCEAEAYAVEDREVGPGLVAAVDRRVECGGNAIERDTIGLRDDMQQLDPARGDAGKKRLGWRDFLAGTAILYRAIDDEVMLARAAEHSAEDISRACADLVFTDWLRGSHVVTVTRLVEFEPG